MDFLATVAQRLDLGLYLRIHRVYPKKEVLSQVLPLEIVIILRPGWCTLDDAPPIRDLFGGTWWHVTTRGISSWSVRACFCRCCNNDGSGWACLYSDAALSPKIGPLVTGAAIRENTHSGLAAIGSGADFESIAFLYA